MIWTCQLMNENTDAFDATWRLSLLKKKCLYPHCMSKLGTIALSLVQKLKRGRAEDYRQVPTAAKYVYSNGDRFCKNNFLKLLIASQPIIEGF